MGVVGGQTKLNEFLRYGAAGSSGTVVEPYTIPQKFPSPMVHVHYARGSSLAEAFYQSINGPFQTLIVGDALCQPFAKPPKVLVTGIDPMETVSGLKRLSFNKNNSPVRVAGMEMFIDGVLRRRDRSMEPIEFDTKLLTDGYHEIRVVFVASNSIGTTSRSIIPLVVNNDNQSCFLSADKAVFGVKEDIKMTFAADGANKIQIFQHEKLLHEIERAGGVFSIPAKELGRGPTTVRAIATINDREISSKPLSLKVNGPVSETRATTGKQKAPKKAASL